MRTDAVNVILEVVARMRQLDPRLKVTWEPGWERRGNGLTARYIGGIVHDTTTPSSAANPFPTQNTLKVGRIDLSGPLCNFAGPYCTLDAPWIHVVAAFPANHAGASGGRSMGPLPKTSLFNPTVLGMEIDFSGLALMPAGQMYVGHLWSRAVADVLAGGNVEYVRAHFETSVTGKIDISYRPGRSYDMAQFRRDAAATAQEDDDMTPDQAAALNEIRGFMQNVAPAVGQIAGRVADIHGKMTTRYDLDGRPGPDEDDLYGHILSARAAVEQAPPAGKVAVDAAAVGAALAADDKFMGALSARIAEDIAARLQS